MGSSPNSSEPVRATTCSISGNDANSMRSICLSISSDDESDMVGDFSNCTIISPSSITGMKVLPVIENRRPLKTSKLSATMPVNLA